ncbi:MAG TPA: crosslink repair DNA glycosylase YcaQ family protein [Trueperaceae bacterium]
MQPLEWSRAQARRFLATYHFTRGSLGEVLARLGSIQFDPLRPLGCNHDLVLQARVPGYRVDDWQQAAYGERLLYDAWDKQACLVPPGDWPYRTIYRDYFERAWQKRILGPYASEVERTLEELSRRGPLSSLDFEDQTRVDEWAGSWYGPKLVKQILRALWDSGHVVTHHRVNGRHVYALPTQVIPEEHLCARPATRRESLRFVITRRHQTAGLLRDFADGGLWGDQVRTPERRETIAELVAEGVLTTVDVEGDRYHLRSEDLRWLDLEPPEPRMVFVAPLDSIMWDRTAVSRLFGFDYVWEVYKPESERRWGYYVLPVFYRDRFVARMEAKVEGGSLRIERWWWEEGVEVSGQLLEAFAVAAREFSGYLGAGEVKLGRRMAIATRKGLAEALLGRVDP